MTDTCKRGLLKTMLDRTFRLSLNWSYFSKEFDRLKVLFSRLKYPGKLINSTITCFIAVKASDQPVPPPIDTYESDPVRVVFIEDLSQKIGTTIQPVVVSYKIEQDLKLREAKPPIVNRQCLVYKFECDLCDAGYVGFTCRHFHQRVEVYPPLQSANIFATAMVWFQRILTRNLAF